MESQIASMPCSSCGAKMRADAFAERAFCKYCGSEQIISSEKRPALRPAVLQPSSVSIENDSQSARIVQRWFSLKYIPMAFFAVAWDAFLLFWYGMAFAVDSPWIMIVFPMAHVAVGVGITYSTLAGFLNRTILEITPDNVSIRFQPLPWFGKKQFRTSEIKQLFCKEKLIRSKNNTHTRYELYAINTANQQFKLLGHLDEPDIAIFFEQQLERWLKIDDRPVAGEVTR
jgi:hypothetical protein